MGLPGNLSEMINGVDEAGMAAAQDQRQALNRHHRHGLIVLQGIPLEFPVLLHEQIGVPRFEGPAPGDLAAEVDSRPNLPELG
jgi:hypothetical protein